MKCPICKGSGIQRLPKGTIISCFNCKGLGKIDKKVKQM